jgi:CBS domain-containing protein
MPNRPEENALSGKRESVLTPSLEQATVGGAMRPGIISCSPDTTAVKLARQMATHHVHSIFVMHPGEADPQQPYVWGIVSDLDLLQAALRHDPSASAASLAQQPMITVNPEMPLNDAAAEMVKHRVSHLVVEDRDTKRPIGVLSTTDVAEVFAWGEG